MNKIFTNPHQLEEWVEAAECIENRHGIERALGYLIGEKFYSLLEMLYSSRKIMRAIDEEQKTPGFNPIRVTKYGNREVVTDLDELYKREKEIVIGADGWIIKFVFLVNRSFSPHDIRKYFASNPRLGIQRHVSDDKRFEFMVKRGALEHSIETEVQDALIFGDMMKYFGVG